VLKTELTPRQRTISRRSRLQPATCSASSTIFSTFSKIEANKLTLENTEFELEKCWTMLPT